MMKITRMLIKATLITASALSLGLAGSAVAQQTSKALVACGPHGAPRIVDTDDIPVGCQVLQENYRN